MRIVAIAMLCALGTLPAHAQQVEVIKARGANAAGICAGALDMRGKYLSEDPNAAPAELLRLSRARDFFLDLHLYPSAEVSSAASAFVTLMQGRIGKATSVAERQGVEREIVGLAKKCYESAVASLQQSAPLPADQAIVPTTPVQPTLPQPYVFDDPVATQPIVPAN